MDDRLLHIPSEFCRNAGTRETLLDVEAQLDTAEWLITHMCEHIGAPDLGALDVLDFGCGVRFAQAIVNRALPVQRYVGVDVYREMIDYLAANARDPRLEFVHLDARNELYNPGGQPLRASTRIGPIEGRQFDLICLFSVFTHLAPHDYVIMLQLLRRFVRPGGHLFYTLFIDERTEGGYGLSDRFARALRDSADPRAKERIAARLAAGGDSGAGPAPFRDVDPSRPLLYALYSREHALELAQGTGWTVESVSPPGERLQHHVVARPA